MKNEAAARVLIVDDEVPLRIVYQQRLLRKGFDVKGVSSGEEALKLLESETFDVALVDIRMQGMDGIAFLEAVKRSETSPEVIMITGHGSIDSAIHAMKLGAYHYLTKPCKLPELEATIEKAYEKGKIVQENTRLKDELSVKDTHGDIVFGSQAMKRLMDDVAKVARTDSAVIIEGESGVGKELIAYAVHRQSPRREHSYIAINCSNLQENLVESELFGHEEGAFSGAVRQKRGLIEIAHGGTLFIDEVGEMNLPSQAKLLRVLENGTFRRVGGNRELRADVRVVAATNRSLAEEVSQGNFRRDLFFRLNVILLTVPPLRDRKEDIPLLVDYFLRKKNAALKMRRTLSPDCLGVLRNYGWPGNVRELSNVVERAMILSSGDEIRVGDFAFLTGPKARSHLPTLKELEENHILQVLRDAGNNKTQAARMLGISTRNLYRKLNEYGVS
jgi:DNA-binding NtrC family response regulator